MSNYTPGPWRYNEGDKNSAPWVVRGSEGGFSVLGNTESRAEADAKLISCAPELLEALKVARDKYYNSFEPDNQASEYYEWSKLIKKAGG